MLCSRLWKNGREDPNCPSSRGTIMEIEFIQLSKPKISATKEMSGTSHLRADRTKLETRREEQTQQET